MDRSSNDTKHSTYSSKYGARSVIGLLLISAALFDRVQSGDLFGQFLPTSIYRHRVAIAFAVDLVLLGSALSLYFSQAWRISRWPIIAGFARTLFPAVISIRNVEMLTFVRKLAWIWIAVCLALIGFIAWTASRE
jgi:hypothetical protein